MFYNERDHLWEFLSRLGSEMMAILGLCRLENKWSDVFMVSAKMQNDKLGENRRHMIGLFNLKMICKLCRVYISGPAKSSRLHTILVIDCVISRLKRF